MNSAMKSQAVPILTVMVPNKSCHSDSQWQAGEEAEFLLPDSSQLALLCPFTQPRPACFYNLTHIRCPRTADYFQSGP